MPYSARLPVRGRLAIIQYEMPSAVAQPQDLGVSKNRNLNEADQQDLAAIDASLKRMRSLIPDDPYVLEIPQKTNLQHQHSYQYRSQHWVHHTPFHPREEENIQYQTFVYHEPGKEIFQLHNSRRDDTAAGTPKGAGQKGGVGGATPSAAQAPKKTMSLSAYKKQKSGATPEVRAAREGDVVVQQKVVKGPVERIKADEEVLAAVSGLEDLVTDLAHAGEKKEPKPREEEVSITPIGKKSEVQPNSEKDGSKQSEIKNELKRRREDETASLESTLPDHEMGSTEGQEPATKKARRSSSSKPAVTTKEPKTTGSDAAELVVNGTAKPHLTIPDTPYASLPPKISPPASMAEEPLSPSAPSPEELPSLPPRLSPTLPANMMATLKAQKRKRSSSGSSELSGPPSASKDGRAQLLTPSASGVSTKRRSPTPRNGFRANSSSPAVAVKTEDRGRPPEPARSPLQSQDIEKESQAQTRGSLAPRKQPAKAEASQEDEEEDKTLIVVLKFKKAKREAVRRLLKTQPRSGRPPVVQPKEDQVIRVEKPAVKVAASDARNRERRDVNAKGVAQPIRPVTPMGTAVKKPDKEIRSTTKPLKRSRSDENEEDEITLTKQKQTQATESVEAKRQGPTTPAKKSARSPNSATKPSTALLSPAMTRKDALSTAMKREQSHDSVVNTPISSTARDTPGDTTAAGTQLVNGHSQASSSQKPILPSTRTPKQQAWETEQKRLAILGRELKHAAQALENGGPKDNTTTTTKSNNNDQNNKLIATKALQSLLAYILAFVCADEAASTSEPRRPPNGNLWLELRTYVGYVDKSCRPIPLLSGLANWLGVVVCARTLETMPTTSSSLKPTSENNATPGPTHPTPRDIAAQMLVYATDADAKLDVDVLQTSFPQSWAARTRGPLKSHDNLIPGKSLLDVEAGYKLPLGVQTGPLAAARAGWALLREWAEHEGGVEGLVLGKG